MTPEEFHAWSQRLQFSKETATLITAIRSSPPVRRVRGRTNNQPVEKVTSLLSFMRRAALLT